MPTDLEALCARVADAQALAAKATPGPWERTGPSFGYTMVRPASGRAAICGTPVGGDYDHGANASLLAAAPDLVDLAVDLLAEVDRLRTVCLLLDESYKHVAQQRDEARAEVGRLRGEREAVVAWLRKRAQDRYKQVDVAVYVGGESVACYAKATEADAAADAIERGEHAGSHAEAMGDDRSH